MVGRERLRPSLGRLVWTLGCGDRVRGLHQAHRVARASFTLPSPNPSRFLIFFSKPNNMLTALLSLLTQSGF